MAAERSELVETIRKAQADSARITTENAELVTVRDAMRTLNQLVGELETSERQKVVLTKHGQMRAVVLSVESYSDLLAIAGVID